MEQEQNMIEVIQTSNEFIIKPNYDLTKLSMSLKINRQTKKVEENKSFKPTSKDDQGLYKFDAFLGLIQILDVEFLLFVQSAQNICTIQNDDIYEVETVQFLPLKTGFTMKSLSKEIKDYMAGIGQFISNFHYFSYTYPLTLRQQKIQEHTQDFDSLFWWNQKLIQDILPPNVSEGWKLQLIQGHVGFFDHTIDKQRLQFFLFTRRSCKRGGTRYTHRGADTDGTVANYAETEQIIIFENELVSQVQIRGSVPLLWEQKGMGGKVLRLSKASGMSQAAFKKHFDRVCNEYGLVHVVNLMKQSVKTENSLTIAYQNEMIANQNEYNYKYEYFDFNTFKNLINETASKYRGAAIKEYGIFKKNISKNQVISKQNGIFRTNCKDCLDRTNNYMMKIGMAAFEHMLQEFSINLEQISQGNPLEVMDSRKADELLVKFKIMWAQTGDNISSIYAGTDATTSTLTKNGYGGIQNKISHKVKSINVGIGRLYKCQLNDYKKQEYMDLLCGNHIQSNLESKANQGQLLLNQADVYATNKENFYFLSVNVMNCNIKEDMVLPEFLKFEEIIQSQVKAAKCNQEKQKIIQEFLPTFLVIGLQEIVEFSKLKMFKHHDTQVSETWKKCIINNIEQSQYCKDEYILVDSHDMLGNILFVFAQKDKVNHIKDIYHDSIKYGFMSQVAENGCVGTHLKYGLQNICFVNVNLPSGRKKWDKRIKCLEYIHENIFQKKGCGKYKKLKLKDHDLVFLFGDFNFRVEMEFKDAKKLIQQSQDGENYRNVIEKLLCNDELLNNKHKNGQNCVTEYFEPEIKFLPSFNDTSKKQRCPSWRHRVLAWQVQGEKLVNENECLYDAITNQYYRKLPTDHQPVYAMIQCNLKVIDEEKSEQRLTSLIQQSKLLDDKSQQDTDLFDYVEDNENEDCTEVDEDLASKMNYLY